MNLTSAVERAHRVSTDLQARRLYNDIEAELSLGNPTGEEQDSGEQALAVLRRRFGDDVEERARDMDDYVPKVSRVANANIAGGGSGGARSRTSGTGRSGAGGGSGGGGSSPSGSRQGRSSGRPAGRRGGSSVSGRRVVERAAGFTGEDVSDTIIKGLRVLLGVGLAYMILAPDKHGRYSGAGAFAGVLSGVQKGVDALVKPVDPFTVLSSKPAAGAPASTSPPGGSGPGTVGIVARDVAATTRAVDQVARRAGRYATGPLGAHVRAPTNPLAAFGGF